MAHTFKPFETGGLRDEFYKSMPSVTLKGMERAEFFLRPRDTVTTPGETVYENPNFYSELHDAQIARTDYWKRQSANICKEGRIHYELYDWQPAYTYIYGCCENPRQRRRCKGITK
jgi:hypothetical protein